MGAESTELVGPDLAQGVDAKELKDLEPFLGHAYHAHAEAVMLVRCGERFSRLAQSVG